MAQLIHMRQRIKAVETIKKITHAMRLIAMSTHTKLRSKQEPLKDYQHTINTLFKKIKSATPAWHNTLFYPPHTAQSRNLIILIGSQKGLCGNFNSGLFRFFEKMVLPDELANAHIIAIGRKAVDYIRELPVKDITALYPEFTSTNIVFIVHELMQKILHSAPPFTHVSVFSNKLKTFFIQKPHRAVIIPFTTYTYDHKQHIELDLIWEHDPHTILDMLALQLCQATIHHLLFESLLAEQAARFISMDSSTRNAETILEETILWYNKLRQAKITKELTELISSF